MVTYFSVQFFLKKEKHMRNTSPLKIWNDTLIFVSFMGG